MLRAGAFIAVRQEQRETAEALPLRFARADELVDDDLGAVGEVAVLAFPDHQRSAARWWSSRTRSPSPPLRRARNRSPAPAADDRRCVAAGCRWRRCSDRAEPRGDGRTSRARCPVREIRTRKAVLDERRVGQRLGTAPVERHLARDHLLAVGDDLRNARVQVEARRQADVCARPATQPRAFPRPSARARSSRSASTCSSRRCTCCRSCRERRAPAAAPRRDRCGTARPSPVASASDKTPSATSLSA